MTTSRSLRSRLLILASIGVAGFLSVGYGVERTWGARLIAPAGLRVVFGLWNGAMLFSRYTSDVDDLEGYATYLTMELGEARRSRFLPQWYRLPEASDGGGRWRWALTLPLWLPAAVARSLAGAVYLKTRRPQLGCCANCGYDLTGNISGRCPECGLPVAKCLQMSGLSVS